MLEASIRGVAVVDDEGVARLVLVEGLGLDLLGVHGLKRGHDLELVLAAVSVGIVSAGTLVAPVGENVQFQVERGLLLADHLEEELLVVAVELAVVRLGVNLRMVEVLATISPAAAPIFTVVIAIAVSAASVVSGTSVVPVAAITVLTAVASILTGATVVSIATLVATTAASGAPLRSRVVIALLSPISRVSLHRFFNWEDLFLLLGGTTDSAELEAFVLILVLVLHVPGGLVLAYPPVSSQTRPCDVTYLCSLPSIDSNNY